MARLTFRHHIIYNPQTEVERCLVFVLLITSSKGGFPFVFRSNMSGIRFLVQCAEWTFEYADYAGVELTSIYCAYSTFVGFPQ